MAVAKFPSSTLVIFVRPKEDLLPSNGFLALAFALGFFGFPSWCQLFKLSNRKRFPCLHSLIKTLKGLGEFETFMQTRDEAEVQTQEKSFLLLL